MVRSGIEFSVALDLPRGVYKSRPFFVLLLLLVCAGSLRNSTILPTLVLTVFKLFCVRLRGVQGLWEACSGAYN